MSTRYETPGVYGIVSTIRSWAASINQYKSLFGYISGNIYFCIIFFPIDVRKLTMESIQ